mmetsp:Transcript_11848/g.13726  ORF Transcript_11848/g.13726 Transcript_11848/m.13726 type:complete len:423 (+) Transcript_11848:323-1591(+)
MVVSTRGKNNVDGGGNDPSSRILEAMGEISARLDKLQSSIDAHGQAIEKLETRNSIAEGLLRTINGEIMETNVSEACGVDPSEIRRSRLLGESAIQRRTSDAQRQERRRKHKVGAQVFTAYVVAFCILMALSFLDMLPVFDWELRDRAFFAATFDSLAGTLHFPFAMCVVYLIVIFRIQGMLRKSEPFDLRTPLTLWSLAIGLFSIFGSLRTVPAMVKMLYEKGFAYSACADTREDWVYQNPAGFWTYYFVLSKVPELLDTMFIVLRKKRLITLHWYHHITVLCFCWHSWATACVNGIFFSSMNLTVHAMMYIFYSLAALGYRPTAYAQYITIIQILQMVVGTIVTFYTNLHLWFLHPVENPELFTLKFNVDADKIVDTSPGCKVNHTNALAGLVMYSSYLYLFCVFFYHAYIKSSLKKKKA